MDEKIVTGRCCKLFRGGRVEILKFWSNVRGHHIASADKTEKTSWVAFDDWINHIVLKRQWMDNRD